MSEIKEFKVDSRDFFSKSMYLCKEFLKTNKKIKILVGSYWNNSVASVKDLDEPYDENNEPLQRHYPSPLAQEFINKFRENYPRTAIINYSLPNEPKYENTERYDIPYLTYIQLAKNNKCIGFVSIDSSLQHFLSGIKPGVVIWGHSLPEAFGYISNTNVIQKCRRDDILYMNLLGPSGAKIEYIKPEELLDIVCKNLINKKEQ